jgi:hypothetical protein
VLDRGTGLTAPLATTSLNRTPSTNSPGSAQAGDDRESGVSPAQPPPKIDLGDTTTVSSERAAADPDAGQVRPEAV